MIPGRRYLKLTRSLFSEKDSRWTRTLTAQQIGIGNGC